MESVVSILSHHLEGDFDHCRNKCGKTQGLWGMMGTAQLTVSIDGLLLRTTRQMWICLFGVSKGNQGIPPFWRGHLKQTKACKCLYQKESALRTQRHFRLAFDCLPGLVIPWFTHHVIAFVSPKVVYLGFDNDTGLGELAFLTRGFSAWGH